MKNKIAGRLLAYFSISLLLFAIVIGLAFTTLFTKHTTVLHQQELQKRAVAIAQILSSLPNTIIGSAYSPMNMGYCRQHGHGSHEQTGYGAYIEFIDQFAMGDIWIVDAHSKLITLDQNNAHMEYGQLPSGGEKVIDTTLKGQIAFSESFSDILGVRSITVGAPIQGTDGSTIGAILLHAPVGGISDAVSDGLKTLLISISAALLLSVPAALLFSLRFTRPLNRMKNTALCLANGDYSVKNEITQKDEIGELAVTMDTLADKLTASSKESEKLEAMRQDFVSNISHELRTPVTVLRGSLEALCDGVVSDAQQVAQYHQQMLAESLHLQRLVNDLLDLSRLQNTDFVIEMSPLDLRALLEDVVRSMRRIAEQKNVPILFECNVPGIAFTADYNRLRQMFMIVIDNAVKFSPSGAPVTIEAQIEDGHSRITVRDTGEGILPEELPYIFDRFRKTKSEQNKNGTGLGLAIAKQIAIRHAIEISVESRPGQTVFSFLFAK